MQKLTNRLKDERFSRYFPLFLVGLGVILRVLVYLQNNSMFIDEANIARNIFERNYNRLLQPLSYEQYAPPVFLWVVKTLVNFFGYSEFAYRLYPLLAGVASLWLMWQILKKYVGDAGLWYGLLLMATGYIYVSYSAITKQYVPDTLIALWLIWLALNKGVNDSKAYKLCLVWAFAGSIAIWASMPAVFVLAGVGCYYFLTIIQNRAWKKIWFLVIVSAIWIAQFYYYYLAMLKPQINLPYLQNCHKNFFFYDPVSKDVIKHNLELLYDFFSTPGGHQTLAIVLHVLCIVIASYFLLRRHAAKAMLLLVPMATVLFAASQHQFSLIPRVALFVMPLLLILISVGLQKLFSTKFMVVNIIVAAACIINFINFNALKYLVVSMENQEMKKSLNYLQKQRVQGSELYVEDLAKPSYIYYTTIHPRKFDRTELLGGTILYWNTNFDSLAKKMKDRSVLLYSWEEPEIVVQQQAAILKYNTLIDSNIVTGGRVYIYERKL